MKKNELFAILKEDHKKEKELLGSLDETIAPKKREQLFKKLREELVPHIEAEETTFYPPLLAKKEAREDALEGLEEHHVTEMVMKELEAMSKDEDQWGAKMAVFKELVEHHIKDEESKVFKSATKVLDPEEMQDIKSKFVLEKQRIKKSLK